MRYAALALLALLIGCAELQRISPLEQVEPFKPGAGGGPGPQGCIAQKERAKAKGEEPTC